MTTPATITSEIQKLSPSTVIELYVLDTTPFGGDMLYFHAGTNEIQTKIVWQGQEYVPFPVKVSGFEFNGGGQLPRPKLLVANISGVISAMTLLYQDLLGAKLTRKRTFAKYLDAVNFDGGVNPSADPTAEFQPDVFFIDRKSGENNSLVEFELAAAFDVTGVKLPRRQIVQNVCPWRYRGSECGYTGTAYFNANDVAVGSIALDVCSKRLDSCKLRFGQTAELPFGGFPAAGLFR